MMRNAFILRTALWVGLLLTVGSTLGQQTQPVNSARELRPVIVQGAMDIEVKKFASRLDNVRVEKVGGWTFWRGTLDGYPVIVSKTMKGLSNAAAATTIAAERYYPVAIINQGPQVGMFRIYMFMTSSWASTPSISERSGPRIASPGRAAIFRDGNRWI